MKRFHAVAGGSIRWLIFLMGFAYATTFAQTLPAHSQAQTLGVVSCASSLCHGSIAPWNGSKVAQNEYVIWSRLDKHAGAYKVLLNERSRQIAAKLSLLQPAHQSAVCLDCHAHNPKATATSKHILSDGVACEACHGPAQNWIARHTEPEATHARNIEDGMYAIEQPLRRAQLCLSCHLGAKDKLVTHRIMAAGHPRMSFEMDTFTSLQPPHIKQDAESARRKGNAEGVQAWAIGQAVAVVIQLDLLMDPVRGRDGAFPELTLFDCNACHHAMSDTRWTSQSAFGQRAAPGLVRLNDSAMVMLRQILRQTDRPLAEKFAAATAQLHQSLAGSGDLTRSARQLRDMAQEAASSLQRSPVTTVQLQALSLALVDDGLSGAYSDYAAAEQASMALGSVINALDRMGQVKSAASLNRALGQIRASLRKDELYQPSEFQNRLRALRPMLVSSAKRP